MLLLKEVMDGAIQLNDELIETLFQCTTCASCEENCPSGVSVPDIIRLVRKDMVTVGSCHRAFIGMNEVLQHHTNIYAEEEPEDFERERNKQAECVYFIGCVGSYREDEATMSILELLDRLEVDYTLIDEVCCSGVLEHLKIPTVGHAGDGNLHPTISFDGTDPDEVRRVEQASAELFRRVIELGGTVTGEHGIGLAKARFMSMEHDEVAMDVMRGIKKLFDPNNILNPGKMALET